MRWLLLKDLQILRRSPLLVGVLVGYSVVVSLVAGVALSSGPSKPTVAFANLVAPDDSEIALGGRKVDASQYADKLFEKVQPIRVKTREAGDREGALGRGAGRARRAGGRHRRSCRARSGSAAAAGPRSRSTTAPRTRSRRSS